MRKSPIAGSWYPGTASEIERLVAKYLDGIELPRISGHPAGLISPHAGIQFSGQTAAYGYKAVQGRDINTVIILGPSHYYPFNGVSVSAEDAYETPLGRVAVDTDIAEALYARSLFGGPRNMENQEHSLEMQLPFLQVLLTNFKIVPLVVGQISGSDYGEIADTVKKHIDDQTLVVASSDFTHYGSRFGYVPFRRDIKKNLEDLDLGAIDLIIKRDLDGYLRYLNRTGATICGAGPIGILMELFKHDAQGVLLNYTTSGELLGDFTDSVSYASVLFSSSEQHG